jgi:protease-4
MDKNRKILLSIFVFLLFSAILSLVNISLTMEKNAQTTGARLLNNGKGVALIRINGPISISGTGSFNQGQPADQLIATLDTALHDDNVKALVLRINSPGGTVGATQEIFAKVMQFRRRQIPVVVSMGDIAASGGYYIACAGNEIFANQGTLTGSIGVITSAPNLKQLFEKYGIQMNVIKSGQYKDILSMARDLTADEKSLLQEMIDSTYGQFLKDVSLGRNKPIDEFSGLADGRIMNGEQALKSGLIDRIGTLEDALNRAREMARLDAEAPVHEYKKSPFEEFLLNIQARAGISPLEEILDSKTSGIMLEYRFQP